MPNEIEKHLLPEEKELQLKQKELDNLSEILAVKELELNDLIFEINRFSARYYSTVLARYQILDELKAQIAEIIANKAPHNFKLKQKAEEAKQQAQETKEEAEAFSESAKDKTDFNHTSEELEKLYRTAARTVHPDKAANEKDRLLRERLMKEANKAYEKGDTEKLKSVLEEYKSSPESVYGEGPGAELIRIIRIISQVKKRIEQIELEINEYKLGKIYEIILKVKEAEKEGKDYLKAVAKKVDAEIQAYQEELANLLKKAV